MKITRQSRGEAGQLLGSAKVMVTEELQRLLEISSKQGDAGQLPGHLTNTGQGRSAEVTAELQRLGWRSPG